MHLKVSEKYKVISSLILIIVTTLVYYPILDNQLLDFWDDQWVVMNSYTISGINLQNLGNILSEFYHGQYAPFNEFLYLIFYSIDGYNPFLFHLASLLLHIVNGILVYIVIFKLFTLSGRVEKNNILVISLITAFIFCIHPFNVESVAWMSASKVLVYALFYLLATITFLQFVETGKKRCYFYTLFLYVFSFFGKEQAVVFPAWMLLIYWFLNHKLSDKGVWLKILPFFVLSIVFGIITIYSQGSSRQDFFSGNDNYPLWQRLVFACYAYLEYIFKILFPVKLSYIYPFPSTIGAPLPGWLIPYPVFILILLVTFWSLFKKQRPLIFGLLFFTIHIIIALHVIPLSRFTIVADRYAYLSTVGIELILAYYLVQCYHKIKRGIAKVIGVTFLCIYLLYFGGYAHERTYTWYNVDTLKKELRELLKQRNDYFKIETTSAAFQVIL